ncbi:MAG: DUF1343 domain-containing protein [Gemmatimonadaceae bacterium]|jgi:uncharacterized protein YbbC (DUF1343 family)|nr:DUF1343 domain-containing protein [Gemmatimonadaceae bacterium]
MTTLPYPTPRAPALLGTALALIGAALPWRATEAQGAAPATTSAASCAAGTDGRAIPGIEVLLRDSLHLLRGKRVGLITNHSGRNLAGTSSIDLLHKAPGVRLAALYGPEHGIRGTEKAGAKIGNSVDSATGVQVFSLYGDTRVPTAAMLENIDVLLYDIQDVGARVYTYPWTMALAAEAAGKVGKRFIVLDRPNPIRNDRVEGGVLDLAFRSFVGQYAVAARYGLTPAELMRWLVGTGQVKVDLAVVPMCGYRATDWYDDLRWPWIDWSPNLRTLDASVLYPGTVFFEGTNLSEGRGTDAPFTQAGAPWLTDAQAIATALNNRRLGGVHFDVAERRVEAGYKHGGLFIPMLRARVTEREAVRPVEVGAWMLREIRARHPKEWQWRQDAIDRLAGGDRLRKAVDTSDEAVESLLRDFRAESAAFEQAVARYRLYR